ncbi:MAG: baseplate J/gp47 family protein [Methylophaga sp.]|nr:baseplate J/gp47 family protein [Methylophaga sp.]
MSFNRPTITELITRAQNDIDSRLPGVDAKLRVTLINAVVNGVAAVSHGLYGHLDWLSKQIIPDTAEDEILERHAAWWGINRLAATPAIGTVVFTGSDGVVIPAGTLLQRSDEAEFATDNEATISSGTANILITASGSGQASNTTANSLLTIVTPVPGINSEPVVDGSGLNSGTDIETIDALRERLRKRVQQPPHGGALHDYDTWAKQVSGVTRSWTFPLWFGDGTVGVFFTRDDDASLIPDASEVAAVQTYLDSVRPVTASVTAIAPIAAAQDMTIQISPNTVAVQTAIEASLKDLFRLEAQVEDGNGSGTLLISHIREAISIATGEADHVLVSPAANITLTSGQLSTLGTITWQTL